MGSLILVLLLCGTPAAWAQAPKVFKVAILTNAFSPWHSQTEGFRDGLKEFGYVEGKNVVFEPRAAQGDTSRLPELASELVGLKPDLLYCNGTAAGRLGLMLLERPIGAPLEMEPGLGELREGGRDGILIVQSGPHLNIPGRSLEVATSNNIPTMYPASFWTKFGALVSYGPDQYPQGRQVARLAHKILTGTPIAAAPAAGGENR